MEALREIVRSHTAHYTMTLPQWAVGRDVEVIVLPLVIAENSLKQNTTVGGEQRGQLSVLGYAKTFRATKTTAAWMQDLRAGEDV